MTHHDRDILVIYAVIVDGRLKKVRILFEPMVNVSTWQVARLITGRYHLGRFNGGESI